MYGRFAPSYYKWLFYPWSSRKTTDNNDNNSDGYDSNNNNNNTEQWSSYVLVPRSCDLVQASFSAPRLCLTGTLVKKTFHFIDSQAKSLGMPIISATSKNCSYQETPSVTMIVQEASLFWGFMYSRIRVLLQPMLYQLTMRQLLTRIYTELRRRHHRDWNIEYQKVLDRMSHFIQDTIDLSSDYCSKQHNLCIQRRFRQFHKHYSQL